MVSDYPPKRILYLGEDLYGTTSRHRRELLDEIYKTKSLVIDFNLFLPELWLLKSLFWRFQHLIRLKSFEQALIKEISGVKYDLVWIDKGLFLKSTLIESLRHQSNKLVFFTPDCFFYQNDVPAVRKRLHLFDLVVTTKSFEIHQFEKYMCPSNLMLVNQGYSKVEAPAFQEKRKFDVLFIGKCEAYRETVVKHLAKAGIRIAVGGDGWRKKNYFLKRHHVTFLGDDFRGEEYDELISKSKICLGLLSKNFPELHTTRTFEIPYFGSVLATERNAETQEFFDEGEALFYNTLEDLSMNINNLLQDEKWRDMAKAGQRKVLNSAYSWEDQIEQVVKRIERYRKPSFF